MICYGPQAGKPSSVPFSWGLPGVSEVISKYQSLSKEEQDKKKLDNKSLLEQQIKKLKLELRLKVEQNQKLEREQAYPLWDDRLNCHGVEDLRCLADYLGDKIRECYSRISHLTSSHCQELAAEQELSNNSLPFPAPFNPNVKGNMFLVEGQPERASASAFHKESLPKNMFKNVFSNLAFLSSQNSACTGLGLQQTYDFPVQSSGQEIYPAAIAVPDLSAEFTNFTSRMPSEMHDYMITLPTDHDDPSLQIQQLHQSGAGKSVQTAYNLQIGGYHYHHQEVTDRSSNTGLILPPATSAANSDVSSQCSSHKELHFPAVLNEWPPGSTPVCQSSVLMQMEADAAAHASGAGCNEPLHLDIEVGHVVDEADEENSHTDDLNSEKKSSQKDHKGYRYRMEAEEDE